MKQDFGLIFAACLIGCEDGVQGEIFAVRAIYSANAAMRRDVHANGKAAAYD